MRKKKTYLLLFTFVIFGFNWAYNNLRVDDCLDSGGQWDYKTGTCIFQSNQASALSKNIIETVWIRENLSNGCDSLKFTSSKHVLYYLEELSWTFSSTYKIEGKTLTILTSLSEMEVNNSDDLAPNLKEQYIVNGTNLELKYLANLRNGSWHKASAQRISKLKNFEVIK